jgi:geranylgeranyl pyrophosphate synthase
MGLNGGLAAYRGPVKARIDAEVAQRLGEWFPGLSRQQQDALQEMLADGKRVRGLITCLVAEALGAPLERALPSALAIEMVQSASLMHDDFVDGDTVRRGRPAAWKRLSPKRAVLLADLAFATAIERMARAGSREVETLAHAIATMAQGALEEALGAGALQRGPQAYRRVIQLKTGSLFAAAARLGALAAGAEERMLEAAAAFGARIGELYQVADDMADDPQGAPALRECMQAELVRLVEQARRALERFPDNERTRMLAELPGHLRAETIAEP